MTHQPEHETGIGGHAFSGTGLRCKHCNGYPFDLRHWTLG